MSDTAKITPHLGRSGGFVKLVFEIAVEVNNFLTACTAR